MSAASAPAAPVLQICHQLHLFVVGQGRRAARPRSTAFGSLRARCASPAPGQFLPRIGARTGKTVNSGADCRCEIACFAPVADSRDGLRCRAARRGIPRGRRHADGADRFDLADSRTVTSWPGASCSRRSARAAGLRFSPGRPAWAKRRFVERWFRNSIAEPLRRSWVARRQSFRRSAEDDAPGLRRDDDEVSAAAHAAQSMLMNTLDCFLESLVAIRATAVVFIDDADKIPADVRAELAAMRAPGTPQRTRPAARAGCGRPSLRSLLSKRADLQSLDASIVRRMNLVPVRVHEPAGDTARSAAVESLSVKVPALLRHCSSACC